MCTITIEISLVAWVWGQTLRDEYLWYFSYFQWVPLCFVRLSLRFPRNWLRRFTADGSSIGGFSYPSSNKNERPWTHIGSANQTPPSGYCGRLLLLLVVFVVFVVLVIVLVLLLLLLVVVVVVVGRGRVVVVHTGWNTPIEYAACLPNGIFAPAFPLGAAWAWIGVKVPRTSSSSSSSSSSFFVWLGKGFMLAMDKPSTVGGSAPKPGDRNLSIPWHPNHLDGWQGSQEKRSVPESELLRKV